MIPAYFTTVDRLRHAMRVEFAFEARLAEWQLMFRDVLAAASPHHDFSVFIDCRAGIRAPQPGDLNRYDRFIQAYARRMAGFRIAILTRTNDPITDWITTTLRDGWAQTGLFRTEQEAHDWLARRPRPGAGSHRSPSTE